MKNVSMIQVVRHITAISEIASQLYKATDSEGWMTIRSQAFFFTELIVSAEGNSELEVSSVFSACAYGKSVESMLSMLTMNHQDDEQVKTLVGNLNYHLSPLVYSFEKLMK